MNELTRTMTFVGAAVLSLVAAVFLAPSVPRQPDEFADVGQEFYPDFDALDATQLRVVDYNEATATAKEFSVALKDGLWQITSHNNYPADGKDRLAKTAASVIGIKREEFKTRNPDDYAGLGVIDPLLEDTTKLKGRGQRITLQDAENKVLADYIVGDQVEDRDGFYFVRRPDEKSVYVAKLDNIDVSTRFSDWIESDLLKATADEIRQIAINKYSIDEAQRRIVDREFNQLDRDSATDPWRLEGLNPETEELNTDNVKKMVDALDNLKIVGVRKKPEGLSQDLKLDKGIGLDAPTMIDLSSRGFMFTPDGNLLANEGEMVVGLSTGVAYVLRFGEVFSGTELEAERGITAADGKQKDGEKKDDQKEQMTESRYLFVTAQFDPKYLGEKPVPPEKPAAPEPETPAEKPESPAEPDSEKTDGEKPEAEKTDAEKSDVEKPKADGTNGDETESDDATEVKTETKEAEVKDTADKSEPDANASDANNPDSEKPEDAKPETEEEEVATPEQLQEEYAQKLKAYEEAIKEYDEKVKKGEELVSELNQRFADWYYVISAESFNQLRLSRKDLVKEKIQTPPTEPEKEPGTPEAEKTDKPEAEKPEGDKPAKPDTETPKSETPEPEKPASEKPKEEEPKPEKPGIPTDKPEDGKTETADE